ncbi:uncharacterized protein LOC132303484 isoform X2 [Cornus florida]|uniref:uncharacterized protein LOC132303484 isoform X2 n=1 Tax=Cornus florida TaxID=4283 RepID=UPI00289BA3F5|nr:uncharacterized protein LOC132303484 isoform X2 [Cornus florida]
MPPQSSGQKSKWLRAIRCLQQAIFVHKPPLPPVARDLINSNHQEVEAISVAIEEQAKIWAWYRQTVISKQQNSWQKKGVVAASFDVHPSYAQIRNWLSSGN